MAMPDLSKAVSGLLAPMHKPGAAGVAEDGGLEPVQCSTVIIAFFGLRWECREASSRVGGNGHRSFGIVSSRLGGGIQVVVRVITVPRFHLCWHLQSRSRATLSR